MFCVECGKDGVIFKDGVCLSCYLKSHTFSKGPNEIDLPVCNHCGSFKYKNTWTSDLFGDVLRKIIKNTFQIKRELQKVDINTECKETKNGMLCKVYISGVLDGVEISEEHNLLVHQKNTVCDICSKRFGGYHEAILQIRTEKRTLKKNELENIRTVVENLVQEFRFKGNRGLFITDIGEEHRGLDFYLSEKGPALIIAKKIKDRYGGTITQSSKNVGMKDSRQIYRMTYLVRLPPYKKGDFIKHNKKFFFIVSIFGNKVKMLDLSNWKESILDVKTIEKASILGGEELVKEMIFISQTKDEVQIMGTKSYKINIIKKPSPISIKDKKIKIVELEDKLFLFPIF